MYNQSDQTIFDVLNLNTPMEFNSCEDFNLDQDFDNICEFLDIQQDIKKDVEALPSTADSSSDDEDYQQMDEEDPDYLEQPEKDQDMMDEQPLSNTGKTIYFSEETENQRRTCLNGKINETQNIGKHLRIVTSSFLEVCVSCRCFSPEAVIAIKEFNKSHGSLKNFQDLFSFDELRQKCREFYESKHFVEQLLKSKMDMESKTAMIRHLETFRSLTYEKKEKWKMNGN